jgi:hypothetical protein
MLSLREAVVMPVGFWILDSAVTGGWRFALPKDALLRGQWYITYRQWLLDAAGCCREARKAEVLVHGGLFAMHALHLGAY